MSFSPILTGLFPNLNKFIPPIIFSEFCLKSILRVSKLSSSFACFFINFIFEFKFFIFLKLKKLNNKSFF